MVNGAITYGVVSFVILGLPVVWLAWWGLDRLLSGPHARRRLYQRRDIVG